MNDNKLITETYSGTVFLLKTTLCLSGTKYLPHAYGKKEKAKK